MAAYRQDCGGGNLLYRRNVKLMGEQKAENRLNLQGTIYRCILSKEKTLFLFSASPLVCVLDAMAYNEVN